MTQLAERAGVTKQHVSMAEKGTANFGPANLSRIAEALGCTVADLLPDEVAAQ